MYHKLKTMMVEEPEGEVQQKQKDNLPNEFLLEAKDEK